MLNFEALIFDCDGVLVDSESLSIRILLDSAKMYGCELEEHNAVKLMHGLGFPDCRLILQDACAASLPDDFEDQYRELCRRRFTSELLIVDGVRQALDELDILTCVASNSPRSKIEDMLSIVGLSGYFGGRIFSAYGLGAWKPDPAIYYHVANMLSLDPRDCAVVEDSNPGIIAGLRAGMTVFAYCSTPALVESIPEEAIIFHDMSGLPTLVARMAKHE